MGEGMRAVLRYLLLALGIAALVLAGMKAPMAAALGGMSGRCAHCGTGGHAPAKAPLCGVPVCVATAIAAATPLLPAAPVLPGAAYAVGPVTPLSGAAPKTDPPPPRSFPAL